MRGYAESAVAAAAQGGIVRTTDIPLKLAMEHATRVVLGKEVATQHNYIGLDECRRDDPARVDDYIEVRHREPTLGYLTRRRLFEERLVYLGKGQARGK